MLEMILTRKTGWNLYSSKLPQLFKSVFHASLLCSNIQWHIFQSLRKFLQTAEFSGEACFASPPPHCTTGRHVVRAPDQVTLDATTSDHHDHHPHPPCIRDNNNTAIVQGEIFEKIVIQRYPWLFWSGELTAKPVEILMYFILKQRTLFIVIC